MRKLLSRECWRAVLASGARAGGSAGLAVLLANADVLMRWLAVGDFSPHARFVLWRSLLVASLAAGVRSTAGLLNAQRKRREPHRRSRERAKRASRPVERGKR